MPIIIDGDKTKIVQQVIEREILTSDFLKELSNQTPLYFPVMPNNLKGLVSSSGSSALIVEQAPRTQTIVWNGNTGTARYPVEFIVHLPYTYFVLLLKNAPLAIEHIQMFFAKSAVVDEDSPTGWMMIPNIRANSNLNIGEMCHGEIRVKDDQTLPFFVADLISQVWGSLFNRDHVNVQQDGADMIIQEMKKYPTTFFQKKIETAESEADKSKFAVLAQEAGAQYLYAWDALTNATPITEFIKNLQFRYNWNYKTTLAGIKTQMRR